MLDGELKMRREDIISLSSKNTYKNMINIYILTVCSRCAKKGGAF